MIDGNDAIILTEDDAVKLLRAVYQEWTREKIEELQKLGALEVVNELRRIIDSRDSD